MVFGLFSKKPPPPPESIPLPPSPSPSKADLLPPPEPTKQAQTQLRTPSPSAESASAAHGAPQSPSPAARMARLSVDERGRQGSPTRQAGPSNSAQILGQPAFAPPEATVESLTTHLMAIPAKTLHAYILSHIPRVPEVLLPALATFFAELSPPEKLHCLRCHKEYVEVENDDRSCLVAHDDESAEVERVGRGAKGGRPAGDPGTTYETIWGCCGKVTEGDGDQGPPDGWCYEGKHTTDIKRARFRADSTPTNDKLVSCLRLNCHGIRDQLPRASQRKRRREVNLKEASTEDDDMSEGEADSGVDEIMGRTKDRKGKGKAKEKQKNDVNEQMEVDDSASRAGSIRGRGRGRPPKSATNTPSGAGAPKRRGRPPKSKVQEATDMEGADADVDDTMSVRSSVAPAAAPKRRGRKPKSKAYIDDSDAEMRVEDSEMERERNRARREKGPRTRSQSRTRGAEVKPKSKARKTRDENINGTKSAEDEEDELPKKKRKTAA